MGKIETIRSFYESKMDKGLPDYMVLGWEGPEAQYRRFEVLASHVDLSGMKILDVGCGLGNLLEYLNSRGIAVDYTGVDISEKMIESVRKKKLPGNFLCVDIFKTSAFDRESFDVVFASGIFNINLGNNREFLAEGLDRFFQLSGRFVAFNLLHVNSPDREDDKYYYFTPEEVKEIISGLPHKIKRIEFVEGYLQNDFTAICEKGSSE